MPWSSPTQIAPAGEADPRRRDAGWEPHRLDDLVRANADPLDGAAVSVRHPDRAECVGEVVGRAADRDRGDLRRRRRVEAVDAAGLRHHPDRAGRVPELAGRAVGRDALDDRVRRRVDLHQARIRRLRHPDRARGAGDAARRPRHGDLRHDRASPRRGNGEGKRRKEGDQPHFERHARRLRSAAATPSPKRGSDRFPSAFGYRSRRTASSTSPPLRSWRRCSACTCCCTRRSTRSSIRGSGRCGPSHRR